MNKLTPRGFRGRGGGRWPVLPNPPVFRGTSTQVCGLWPFSGGSARPSYGVPVGLDINTGSTVCCDSFSYFDAGLISSPSMTVLGLNGFGKSSFAMRQAIGAAAMGIVPMWAGDLKGEYSKVTRALGGEVLEFNEGFRHNILALGSMAEAAQRLTGARRTELVENALQRTTLMVATLIKIARRAPVADYEFSILAAGIRLLYDAHDPAKPPVLPDLIGLIGFPTDELRRLAQAASPEEYRLETRALNRSLQAIADGPLGRTFSGQSTAQLSLDAPAMSIDLSWAFKRSDDVLAAVMFSTWSEVFASIEAANALADAGVAPQRHVLTVMDEMWRAMRLEGVGLVDTLDEVTRLNRNEGVGNLFITHSPKDFASIGSAADVQKAQGFVERSGIVVTAALAEDDLRSLSAIKRMSEKEIRTVSRWSTPPGWQARVMVDPTTGKKRRTPPPDAGKVLIKVGERAGIPTQARLTGAEQRLHDTDSRWVKPDEPPHLEVAG